MRQLLPVITTGWNPVRWMRLGLGAVILYGAIRGSDWFMGTLALVFILQAIFNMGCCGASGCMPSSFGRGKTEDHRKTEETVYEEIK